MNIKKRYITGVDGIRAIAVISVILYHLLPKAMPGGYLGVALFFVISGYLITDILLTNWFEDKKLHLKRFYRHRIRRIFPSLIGMLVVSSVWFLFTAKPLLNDFRQVVISSLLNVNNWWQILNNNSYFDRFQTSSPYIHLWSLSIEGQFYLFFPLILGFLLHFKKKKKTFVWLFASLTGLSAVAMGIIYYVTRDVNRVYYGTDTRIFSILLGCLLAILTFRIKRKPVSQTRHTLYFGVGLVNLLLIFLCFYYFKDYLSIVYEGGMFLFSLLGVGLLFSVIPPNSWMNRLLSNPVFTWIGKRSYEIYLWQYPVMLWYNHSFPKVDVHRPIHFLIQMMVILLLSELTYRLIDYPIRYYRKFAQQTTDSQRKLLWLSYAILIIMSAVAFTSSTSGDTKAQDELKTMLTENSQYIDQKKEAQKKETPKEKPAEPEAITNPNKDELLAQGYTEEQIRLGEKLEITAVGDSLLLNIAPNLTDIFPKITVDGEIGRQLMNSISIFEEMNQQKELKQNVLIVLGTNGNFTSNDLEKIIDIAGTKRNIFLVNTNVPQGWEGEVNQLLQEAADKHNNVYLIDWKGYSTGNVDWFYEDNTHVNEDGSKKFAYLVSSKILEVNQQEKQEKDASNN